MLKKYKNQIFEYLKELDPDHNRFNLTKHENGETVIEAVGSPLKFSIFEAPGNYHYFYVKYVCFNPNMSEIDPAPDLQEEEAFPKVLGYLEEWIMNHVNVYFDEQLTPDLWEQVYSTDLSTLSGERSNSDSEQFTDDEKKQLRLAINDFGLRIQQSFELTAEQLANVNERLDYLSEGVDRLNRFDWKGLAMNTVVTIGLNLAFDPQKTTTLLTIFREVFIRAVHLLQ